MNAVVAFKKTQVLRLCSQRISLVPVVYRENIGFPVG